MPPILAPRPLRCPRPLLVLPAVLLGLVLQGCSPRAQEVPVVEETPWVAVARGEVDVEGGLLELAAPQVGVVARVLVHEGDTVAQGQALATLRADAAELDLAQARAALAQAEASAELGRTRHRVASAQAKRLRDAASAGVVQGQEAEQARADAAVLQAQQAVDRAAVARARQEVAQAQHVLEGQQLVAPQDMRVVRVLAQTGTVASPDKPLFVLLPDVPHIVRAELNESFADAVAPGMRAQIAARDGQLTWPGRVLRVGRVYGPSRLAGEHADLASTRVLECVLAIDSDAPPAVGRHVMVRILDQDADDASH